MEKSPDAFRTISEVADWLDVPTHVLRFWESRFSQVKPVKRAGGRRYYRPNDMRLIGGIKTLLHDQGMTIRGVQKLLREEGVKHVAGFSQPLDTDQGAQVIDITPAEPPAAAPAQDTAPEPAAPAAEPPSEPAPAAPRLTFGSVRQPVDDPAPAPQAGGDDRQMDLIDEIAAAEEAETAPAAEAAPEPAAPPAPMIPPTPGVPDTDPGDDAAAHASGPGLAARLIARDRTRGPGDPALIGEIAARLREVRGKTGT